MKSLTRSLIRSPSAPFPGGGYRFNGLSSLSEAANRIEPLLADLAPLPPRPACGHSNAGWDRSPARAIVGGSLASKTRGRTRRSEVPPSGASLCQHLHRGAAQKDSLPARRSAKATNLFGSGRQVAERPDP